ncbi:MAG: GTP 3',8-cyclase MoaA [Acidiferrobacterales bacterium]
MNRDLIDPFQRKIEYIRLSVTDRCDLRCIYCMPKGFDGFNEPEDWLTFDEIERVISAFTALGVKRVRITGGEPLARRHLPDLVKQLHNNTAVEDLSLSTNAVQLARHAESLYDAGISRINVSLDSLKADRFSKITGGGKLEKVLKGLQKARETGFQPIKINMVAMRGINDDEFSDMLRFCIDNDFALRFIETMPIGDTGRDATETYLNLQDVRRDIERQFELVPAVMPGGGPARYFRIKNSNTRIGFITPISQHFCETCNRVRLSVDGTLYLCLGQEDSVALRPHLRQGISNEGLEELIVQAIALKPERHEFREHPEKIIRFMSMTGG